MAHALRSGLRNGGLRRGGLHAGLEGGSIFNIASLDLNFAKYKNIGSLVTFTRASSGTFVGSDGVLRTAVTNLLLRSEEFDNASWVKQSSVSVSANTTIAPNGTLTADTITWTSASVGTGIYAQILSGLAASVTHTRSIYVRADSAGGTVELADPVLTVGITTINLTTEWQRIQLSENSTVSSGAGVWIRKTASSPNTIYLWGAQLEQSTTVGEYIPTTSTINSAPRFDHNPTTGESLGLLVEEARSNLCLQSEDLSTTWGTTNYTVTTNAATAPNGTVTADKLIRNTTDTTTSVTQNVTATASTAYNYSIFVKASEWSKVGLREGSVSGNYVTFDLSNGTIVSSSGATGAISTFANGWYRISMQMTTGAAQTSYGLRLIPLPNNYTSGTPAYSFAGDGTSGLFAWGAQLEQGAFATSPILTSTAAATRSADVASITGSNFSSWYNQTEGTVFADVTLTRPPSTIGVNILGIGDGTNSNRVQLNSGSSSAGNINGVVTTGGVAQAQPLVGSISSVGPHKIGFGYATNNVQIGVNGSLGTEDTSATMPSTITAAYLANGANPIAPASMTFARLTFWPTRLASNILQSITQ